MPCVADMIARPPLWLSRRWTEDTVTLSSEVKVSRNLAGHPFPATMSVQDRRSVSRKVAESLSGMGYEQVDLEMEGSVSRSVLKERRLISKGLATGQFGTSLFKPSDLPGALDESLTVSTNDNDHIRIRAQGPGMALKQCVTSATGLEQAVSISMRFAKSDSFGYLTTLYQESGSGMRLSVILHLPGLVLTNRMEPVLMSIRGDGVTCSGCFGDETMGIGNMFHVHCEPGCAAAVNPAVEDMGRKIEKVVAAELEARGCAKDTESLDTVARAYGAARAAVRMDFEEAICSLSLMSLVKRLGLGPLDPDLMRVAVPAIMSGHMHTAFPKNLDEQRLRADLIRSRLWGKEKLVLD